MIRKITIRDTENDQGFDRYTIILENGEPYLENPPVIGTNDPQIVFIALVEFLRDRE